MLKEIIKKLQEYKKEIMIEESDTKTKLYQQFIEKYPFSDPSKLTTITFSELFLNLILLKADDYDKSLELFQKNSKFLSNYNNIHKIKACFFVINTIQRGNMNINDAKQCINNIALNDKSSELPSVLQEIALSFKDVLFFVSISDETIEELTYLFANLDFNDLMALDGTCIEINKMREFNKFNNYQSFMNKPQKLVAIPIYYEILNNLNIKIEKENKNNKRKANKKLAKIDSLITILKKEGEIKEIDEILNLCPEKLLDEVLNFIMHHNNVYYEALYQNLSMATTSTDENLSILFANFGYDYQAFDILSRKNLQTLGYQALKESLIILYNLQVIIPLEYFPNLSLDNLKRVNSLITDGILSIAFLKNNLNLLLDNNTLLEDVLNQICLLSSKGINIRNYPNSLNILLSSNLLNNLNILEKFNLNITKQTQNISFLGDFDIEAKLNLMVELGLDRKNLDLLNLSIEDIYLKKLAQALNISREYLSKDVIFRPAMHYVDKSAFAEEKLNAEVLPEIILPFKKNDEELVINGITVSLNRFYTNYSKLKVINNLTIFYALIYNSFYNIDEIEIIKETLNIEEQLKLVRK